MKLVQHVVKLPNTSSSTLEMAQWCRDNGVPVLHKIVKARWSNDLGNAYRGTKAMIARGRSLDGRFKGLSLNQKGKRKIMLLVLREEDLVLFRCRFN